MRKRLIGIGLFAIGAVLVTSGLVAAWSTRISTGANPTPVERLIPTAGPTVVAAETGMRPSAITGASSAPTASLTSMPSVYSPRQRVGIGVPFPPPSADVVSQLNPGWYLDWRVSEELLEGEGIEYVPMIRLKSDSHSPDLPTLARVAASRPGSLWLIGNEPDVKWQDNVLPGDYAHLYHDLHVFLKEQDPSCRVAIGGVSQPTPLRLRYLEAVLAAYKDEYGIKMPVDVWNVHAFILREEADSWGVDIPPGFSGEVGQLYQVEDHDDMSIFKRQIEEFRRWMKAQGEQDKPLIVSEYGILMPEDYGFPAESVERFMIETLDYFLSARDADIGYPQDGGRLVQRWCWYSLADSRYPTGNLMDPETGRITSLGQSFAQYRRLWSD